MKKLLYIILLLPLWVNAQTNGTIQKTSATGTIRGSFGALGLDTLPRVTGALVDGYILKYHAATNKWYASPDGYIAGLQDSLTKKANRTFDNVASGAIANVKLANSTISGVALGSNLNALTLGNGLTGTSYNGSANVTARADTAVVQTVLNFFPKGDTRWLRSTTAASTYLPLSGGTLTGTLNGTTITTTGTITTNSGLTLTQASANRGGLYPYNVVVGSGTDYTPTFISETGSGLYFSTNGSASPKMILSATGALNVAGNINSSQGLITQTIESNDTEFLLSTRNTSAGTSAVSRNRFGNNATPNALTIDVFGSNYTSLGNYVRIFNQNNAPLQLGGYGDVALELGSSNSVKMPALAGTGTRMTVSLPDGTQSTQPIPTGGGGGSVTGVAVASANGFSGTSDGATVVPTLTISTSINSPVLAGNGTAISAATTTGSGSTVVLSNTPTLVTPVIGVATGTSLTTTGSLTTNSGLALTQASANRGGIFPYNVVAGSGTDYTPTLISETGLGLNFATNGSATPKMTLSTGGNLVVTGAAAASNLSGTNTGDQNLAPYATLASPALTGAPTAPTQTAGDNSTKIATTAYVDRLGGGTIISNRYDGLITAGTNVGGTSYTVNGAHYQRIGNEVTVTGRCSLSTTASGASVFYINLPVASNLATGVDLLGRATSDANSSNIVIYADTGGDRATVEFTAAAASSMEVYYNFTYTVL